MAGLLSWASALTVRLRDLFRPRLLARIVQATIIDIPPFLGVFFFTQTQVYTRIYRRDATKKDGYHTCFEFFFSFFSSALSQ